MAKTLFVTGTDTDAGKTHLSCALLAHFARQRRTVAGLKPVASGGRLDAERLWQASGYQRSLDEHNPYWFSPAIAPHLAAAEAGVSLTVAGLQQALAAWQQAPVDGLLVEGAGGWRVPLNNRESFADLATAMNAAVILVVGMKLGCVNHALLTAEAIQADGLPLLGWVANAGLEPMDRLADNLAYLRQAMPAPLLATAGKQTPESITFADVTW
ncbi:dethiobiotin synthase [Gallaecimonas sp. GXIMD1310]|uniref:dethiobiotin synthase n=1 Tax=Gallaecimonas sp. GXIMD1310 TaxID=3131926 RepID=UPI003250976D